MKKIFALLSAFFCFALLANAKSGSDDIIGLWLTANGKGHVQIYKEGTKYYGKIVWLKEPNGANGLPKLDTKNPNKTLLNKPIVGTIILHDFVFEKDEWNGGKIYDPENGKEYKSYLKLKDANTLALRGYIGFSLIGRTEIWTKIK